MLELVIEVGKIAAGVFIGMALYSLFPHLFGQNHW